MGKKKKDENEAIAEKHKKNRGKAICNVLGTLLLVIVILLCIPLTLPRLFGCQIYNVVSGSMEPDIPTGSLVYVQRAEAAKIARGDVIAFYGENDTGAIITHRVVKNQVVSGQFITKGDANEKEDLSPVSYDRFIGEVSFHMPVLGSVLAYVATLYGKITVAVLVLAAILLRIVGDKKE